jgi:tetratricopeptide (TPR) repeat protein
MTAPGETYRKAQELAAASKNEAALIAFQEAYREEPSNFKTIFGAGLMHQRLREHPDAIAAFSKVIEMQPRIADAYYSRALSLQDLGQHSEALVDLDFALELKPQDADTLYAQGVSLRKLKRQEEAFEAYSAAIRIADGYPEASDGRGKIRYAKGDYAGAIADFSDCLAGGLDSYDVRLLRGLSHYYLNRHKEAIEDLSAAVALRPNEGGAYLRRGQVYSALGDKVNAAKDFKIGSQLIPTQEENLPT